MQNTAYRAIAIVGAGAVLPDAPNVAAFWNNIKSGRYSISEVPVERWNPALYYDPDPAAPDKTYTKIGGWVREHAWDPLKWHMPIPPRVAEAMDLSQQWGIVCTREALEDYGYPKRPLNLERTAVILGNALAGEKHYLTSFRVYFPEYARELDEAPTFAALPENLRRQITNELRQRVNRRLPEITEDSMPGELANCLAGRIANLYNLRGPNFTTDAACASSMAAISAAAHGLVENDFDVAITGGIDRNMGAPTFVKFCKIGALSATGSRPFADGADGFVMGEGAVILILKRLADAERDGDKIYAVLRGIAGSSDGKGKGITAPNPIGQKLAVERAWQNAGVSPTAAMLMEAHGTSTRVGDAVEFQTLMDFLSGRNLPAGSVALGSVKSNIGHLKSAAGGAGLLKTALALRDKVLPPSLNCEHPNPNIDFAHSPLCVNTSLKPWDVPPDTVRCAGLSAFGFGGTNFHAVLEEHIPHRLTGNGKRSVAVHAAFPAATETVMNATNNSTPQASCKPPLRGALLVGADLPSALAERLRAIQKEAQAGHAPAPQAPLASDLKAQERIAIDYADAADLADKAAKTLKALAVDQPAMWKALRSQGVFRGQGPAAKTAFLYTGQGSQYVNMLKPLRAAEPLVADTFAEADRIMTPLLGKPLSEFIFVDSGDAKAIAQAEEDLRQTAITQPAVIASDIALTRLLAAYGIQPDMAMGHSVGEYGALVASGALPFEDAMEAVSARGREMTRVSMADNGKMLAVFAPLPEIERILKTIDGYVVIANINSLSQAVIGGTGQAVEQAQEAFGKAGYNAVMLQVSHAFHTSIVAPASEPLRRMLERLHLTAPLIPIITNVTGGFYPSGPNAVPQMLDLLSKQVASPVQFVQGLQTLYDAGARVFVELGPKKALHGFAEDVLGSRGDVLALFTNHPKVGDIASFNQALCGLYAAGFGQGRAEEVAVASVSSVSPVASASPVVKAFEHEGRGANSTYTELGRMFADVLERGWLLTHGQSSVAPDSAPVVITGAALGLPGTEGVFDDANIARILRGEQFIDVIPTRFRRAMVDKHITRVVKNDDGGSFEQIDNTADVIKLAGRAGALDLEKEFGIAPERIPALDRVSRLAIGAGVDALRDAGIPLVLHYKTTSKGTQLPDRWGLPDAMRDDTGIIFASAFPGYNALADEMTRFFQDYARRQQLESLRDLRTRATQSEVAIELDRRIVDLQAALQNEPYLFDRRFLFKVLPMGHSQFAEIIGARGPNTQINAACASTTQGVALAEDWIRTGRCRRVIIITADDVTSDSLMDWMGAGFLASGAAATDESVEDAALPFDRRRHGMILGMGAAALVVESTEAARERGIQPICEVLSTVTANSAYHGTRLDVEHIGGVMESLVSRAERRSGISRQQIAPQTVFVSHETYTPARGGSASAEINALRRVFSNVADRIVIANTKGFTGHAMGAGIEDVVAVKALETGCVPPVANFKEVDPELGLLNLSKGGAYPVEYALRLGAGFGSQICMMLLRWVKTKDASRPHPSALGYSYRIADASTWKGWLSRMAGQPVAELEIVQRTLRVRDQKAAAKTVETTPEPQAKAAAVEAPAPPLQAMAAKAAGSASASPKSSTVSPVPSAPPVVEASPAKDRADPVKERLLDLVVEKTGYPRDMLDLDLDLEADLGVDTVKQAELFASIRGAYGIPRDENLKLRDFPTLAHVIQFVYDRRPDLAQVPAAVPPSVTSVSSVPPVVEASPAKDTADPVKERLLDLVVEKTGYPKDMLDLDLDLEADLGVDTVKQAELFAAIREAYGIPRDENLKLRDFPTLAHVIRFVYDRCPGLKMPAQTKTAEEAPTLSVQKQESQGWGTPEAALASLDAANKIPRRVPVPVLRPPLSLCKGTGVTLQPGQRVIVMPDQSGVADALTQLLQDKGVEVLRIENTSDADTLTTQLKQWLTNGPVQGVYWLPALDSAADRSAGVLAGGPSPVETGPAGREPGATLSDMDLSAWHETVRISLKSLYTTMRTLYEQIAAPGTFLVSATRLGGQHGYDEAGAVAPIGGAVTGFTKAYKRERTEALVKAVDFEASRDPSEIAGTLLDETLRDPGAVEIGYKDAQRWTVGLQEQPAADGQPGLTLGKDTVFLITGAAGGIVSAITADLASASGGIFYLLDIVPEPDPENADLKRFATDREGLKRELMTRPTGDGKRATPAQIEKQLAAIERAQAALSAIEAVRAAGGTPYYFSVNLTDADAVAKVIDQIRERSGRIDVLLHAAGMERSHFLPDKDQREFDLVFDVKVDGWFNLLHAIGAMPLGATVAFSSIAGRFGNGGQTDYSSANDLLCKITSSFRTLRPATRGIAIDWTAWGGIGMATRGSIPKMMELAGIDMLPPEAGIPTIRRELTAGGTRGEVVIGQRLGILMQEWDSTGGLDAAAVEASQTGALGPMSGKIAAMGVHSGLAVETTLDPNVQPFLHDHQIEGTPVLPGVMGVEAFAEAALRVLPGWQVAAVEDVTFAAPFKFYRNEPRTVTVQAVIRPDKDDLIADCRLVGSRQLPNQTEPQITTHFTARVRLASTHQQQGNRDRGYQNRGCPTLVTPAVGETGWGLSSDSPANGAIEAADIYRAYFHGPAYQVLEKAWRDGDRIVGLMAENLPANHEPAGQPLVMSPRLIELCFQTAGLWEMSLQGRMGLPLHIDSVCSLRAPENTEGRLYAVVTPHEHGFDAEVLDSAGNVYLQLKGYRTVALPGSVTLSSHALKAVA